MTDTTHTPDLLVTVDEIADFLGIKRRTAEYWIEMGRIPVKRMGRTITASRARLTRALDLGPEAA
jgi:excisionase family DNA binding protein